MDSILKNTNYIKIPLVGNSFCKKKPSKKDVNIALVPEKNPHDPNAIKVISIRNGEMIKLGYVIRDQTDYIRSIMNNIRFVTIITKTVDDKLYYILVFIKT